MTELELIFCTFTRLNHLQYFTRPADLRFVFFCSCSFIKHSGQRLFFFVLYTPVCWQVCCRMPTHSDTQLKTENRNGRKVNETRRYKSQAGCVKEPYNTSNFHINRAGVEKMLTNPSSK